MRIPNMDCRGCRYAKDTLYEEIPIELLYEDVVYCTFLEEYVVQDNEPCVYKRPL